MRSSQERKIGYKKSAVRRFLSLTGNERYTGLPVLSEYIVIEAVISKDGVDIGKRAQDF